MTRRATTPNFSTFSIDYHYLRSVPYEQYQRMVQIGINRAMKKLGLSKSDIVTVASVRNPATQCTDYTVTRYE